MNREPFAISAEEMAERCQRRAMKYWDRLPVGVEPEDIAQEAMLYIIRQGLCGPGTDMKLITHIIKNKVATAVSASWKRKIHQLMDRGQELKDVVSSHALQSKEPLPDHLVEVKDLLGCAISILVPKQQERVQKYLSAGGGYAYAGDLKAQHKEMGAFHPARKRMKWYLDGMATRERVQRRLREAQRKAGA